MGAGSKLILVSAGSNPEICCGIVSDLSPSLGGQRPLGLSLTMHRHPGNHPPLCSLPKTARQEPILGFLWIVRVLFQISNPRGHMSSMEKMEVVASYFETRLEHHLNIIRPFNHRGNYS